MSAIAENLQVLIIDDESQIRKLLRLTLEDAGYVVREADSGRRGLHEANQTLPT